MAIEFSINKDDLTHAMKPFFVRSGRSSPPDSVRVDARKGQVEFASAEFGSTAEAVVTSPGCAMVPFRLFDAFFRRPEKLAWSPAGGITIRVTDGEMRVGATVFNHPEVSISNPEALRVSLPANATSQETLALALRYSEEELNDAGLWSRVQEAKDQAAKMVDKAAKILGPLNITKENLVDFMWDRIRKPAERLKL